MARRDRNAEEIHGILLVDKPIGPTSHDVVDWVRRALRVRRVGHCGTLDPAASGLLVIAVGVATRVVPLLTEVGKRYEAEILLGVRTDAGDLEGAVIERVAVDAALLDQAPAALHGLLGDHMLAPPTFSAIKVDGERAYDRARRGETFELAARPMSVTAVDAVTTTVEARGPIVRATLSVSKGTYIRTLAETVGARLGVPAVLAGLRRTASGALAVDDPRASHPRAEPVAASEGEETAKQGPRWRIHLPAEAPALAAGLIPIDEAVGGWTVTVDLASDVLRRLDQGQPVASATLADPRIASLEDGAMVAVIARDPEGRLRRWILTIIAVVEGAEGGSVLRPQRVLTIPGPPESSPRSA